MSDNLIFSRAIITGFFRECTKCERDTFVQEGRRTQPFRRNTEGTHTTEERWGLLLGDPG